MDCESKMMSKLKDIADNIIKTENDYHEKSLKLYYKNNPDARCVMNIRKYLNTLDCWRNYNFNQYSVRESDSEFIITFNYVAPKVVFGK